MEPEGPIAYSSLTWNLMRTVRSVMKVIAAERLTAMDRLLRGDDPSAVAREADDGIEFVYRLELSKLSVFDAFSYVLETEDAAPVGPEESKPLPDDALVIDPLDGTRALASGSARGIGTSLAVRRNGQFIAGFIGDAMSGDIVGYGPEHPDVLYVHGKHVKPFKFAKGPGPLYEQKVLLRRAPSHHGPWIDRLTDNKADGALFHGGIQVEDGSCALSFVRLWRREVGALILPKKPDTPWDLAAVFPICRMLGFVGVRVDRHTGAFEPAELIVPGQMTRPRTDRIIVHESHIPELMDWHQRTFADRPSSE